MMRTRLAGSVLVVSLLFSGLQAHAAAKPDPKAVNLTLKDLPTGFTLKSGVSRTNAQATKAGGAPVAQENAEGRLLSDDVEHSGQALVGRIHRCVVSLR